MSRGVLARRKRRDFAPSRISWEYSHELNRYSESTPAADLDLSAGKPHAKQQTDSSEINPDLPGFMYPKENTGRGSISSM
jgi:hypothetical protein